MAIIIRRMAQADLHHVMGLTHSNVKETVLWNPDVSTSLHLESFSCIDRSATPMSPKGGGYKITRSQDRRELGPLTVACDASPVVGKGGVENVRVLVGSESGRVDVLDPDPSPGEGQPVIWRLSA